MDISQLEKYRKLGLNIAYYRKYNGLTQAELAESIGVDSKYISPIELGNVGVSLDVVFNIADVFQIPVYKLFEFRD